MQRDSDSSEATPVEVRITQEGGSYEQCAVARELVADPDAWMSASWGNGGLKHMIVCSLKRPSLGRRRCLSSAPTLRTA